jgi:phage terminase large subunit
VGAFVGSKFRDLNMESGARILHQGFGAGGKVCDPDDEYADTKVLNKDYFSNLKAQAWWRVADRFRRTFEAVEYGREVKPDELISINSGCENLEKLIDELTTPRRKFDAAGKVKVESKDELKARDVDSPNLADSFIIAFNPLVGSLIDYRSLL